MSDKPGINPFAGALNTEDNKQQTKSEQEIYAAISSTTNRSKEINEKQNTEGGTLHQEPPPPGGGLGSGQGGEAGTRPRPLGTNDGVVGINQTSGLNPFLDLGTGQALASNEKIHSDCTLQPEEPVEIVVQKEFTFGPQLPKVNCKEKIVICFDLSSEVDRVPFIGRDGTPYNSSSLLQGVLNVFIQTKNTINPEHEFALIVLQEKAIWYQDFTTNCTDVIQDLYDLSSENPDCEEFDLTSLFEILHDNVHLPTVEGDIESLPPPYIVRTIMLYGRSKCIPTFTANKDVCEHFLKSPYFFMDVFYIHEAPTDENSCKEVYDVFLDLDEHNRAYINEVGRNITQLHDKMAMFLAHPLQRPYQQHSQYTLKETEEI